MELCPNGRAGKTSERKSKYVVCTTYCRQAPYPCLRYALEIQDTVSAPALLASALTNYDTPTTWRALPPGFYPLSSVWVYVEYTDVTSRRSHVLVHAEQRIQDQCDLHLPEDISHHTHPLFFFLLSGEAISLGWHPFSCQPMPMPDSFILRSLASLLMTYTSRA